ncbi:MAG: hypothetical protein Q9193_000635 [Seirophora villosa]
MRTDYRYTSLGDVWERAKTATMDDRRWKKNRAVAVALSFMVLVFLVLFILTLGHFRSQVYNCPGKSTPPEWAQGSEQAAASSSSPPSTKIATIIENRPLANLIPLILAFSAVLGPSWPIRIFHSPQNTRLFTTSPRITRLIESNQVTLRLLPPGLNFTTHEPVSAFYATPWLWENLAPAKHVLMFQTDSILCANSLRSVDDFLAYDFIGAPIEIADGGGPNYNGGLSIRNREKMLEVLHHFTRPVNGQFEDQWFAERLRALPPKPDGDPAANLPSVEVASQFSVEQIWKEKPFGMHQISRWHPEKLDGLKSWCPEYQLAIGGGLHPFHKTVATLDVGSDPPGADVQPSQQGA